jgi:hypothetical protein
VVFLDQVDALTADQHRKMQRSPLRYVPPDDDVVRVVLVERHLFWRS